MITSGLPLNDNTKSNINSVQGERSNECLFENTGHYDGSRYHNFDVRAALSSCHKGEKGWGGEEGRKRDRKGEPPASVTCPIIPGSMYGQCLIFHEEDFDYVQRKQGVPRRSKPEKNWTASSGLGFTVPSMLSMKSPA